MSRSPRRDSSTGRCSGPASRAYAVDQGQRVAVGTERSGRLHGPDDVGHRARGESRRRGSGGRPGPGAPQRGQRLGDPLVPAGPLVRRQLRRPAPPARAGAGSGTRPRRARPPGRPGPARAGRRSRPRSSRLTARSSSVLKVRPSRATRRKVRSAAGGRTADTAPEPSDPRSRHLDHRERQARPRPARSPPPRPGPAGEPVQRAAAATPRRSAAAARAGARRRATPCSR